MRGTFSHAVRLLVMANQAKQQASEIVDDDFTRRVLGCGISVHKTLRVGLLESAYETCFTRELAKNGFSVVRQAPLPIE